MAECSVTNVSPYRAPAVPLRVLVAASSSGGHLFPALFIARALQARLPGAVIEFIGAGRPLEDRLIVANGYVRHIVAAHGVKQGGLRGLFRFGAAVPRAVSQLRALYHRFQPDVVVGVGGYVSVLPVVVARFSGIPTWIHEAELHPGLANAVLARVADCASVAFPQTTLRGRARIHHTGHPVRPELAAVDPHDERPGAPQRLLVLGGSQGASGVDRVLQAALSLLAARKVVVRHQARPDAVAGLQAAYNVAGVEASVVGFIDDMVAAYQWADVVVSRAGAGTVAELSCVNRPTIFVPYPHQQGTHQTDNAMTLVRAGKALIVEERTPDFPKEFTTALEQVLSPNTFFALKRAPYTARGLAAADTIAAGIQALVENRSAQ